MKSPVAVFIVACIVSAVTVLAQTDAPPPLGRLVDVGGWRMHIHCTGERSAGAPTVILEAGSSDFSIDWAFVQPEVAKRTRVCSYDRSGSGWSDMGPYPHTMKQIVFELHLLLEKAGESAPLAYVGHSYGGRLARLYASTYPADVRGMVMVDAGHEDSIVSLNGKLVREWELATGRPVPAPQAANPIRVEDLPPTIRQQLEKAAAENARSTVGPPHNKLPAELQRARVWATSQVKYLASNNSPHNGDEILALKNARAATPYPLGDMPVVVLKRGIGVNLAAERGVEREQDRHRLAADLAALSRNGRQLTAASATGHHIHIDEPELVIRAIREVVAAVAGTPAR